MRRNDREITDINEKIDIIKTCKVCRLGLSDNNIPYIIPLNYGYSYENNELTLYFHSAREGRKLEIIKNNNNACFEIDCDAKLNTAIKPCDYGYSFKSIIGFGKIIMIEKTDDKADALNKIMKHQTDKDTEYTFTNDQLQNVCIYKMVIDNFTGKRKVKND